MHHLAIFASGSGTNAQYSGILPGPSGDPGIHHRKVPVPGDEVRHENVLMKVVNVAGRRIGKVRVQMLEAEAADKKEEDN